MERRRLKKRRRVGAYFSKEDAPRLFSSGCQLLDCCLGGGWVERVINIVGDKSTGKTLLACEAATNFLRKYPKGLVFYRDIEAAFDRSYMLRLGIPADRFDYGDTCFCVEDTFEDLTARIEGLNGRPALYIVDSLDALSDRAELKRGLDEGTYGANKAKQLSQLFRRLNQKLSESRMTVIFVSQIRDKIGVMFGERHTRAGGLALDFYASQIVWLAQTKRLKRTVRGVERPVGIQIKAQVKKNKIGPPFRDVEFPLLFDFGIEDVVAGIEWLRKVKRLEVLGLSPSDVKRYTTYKSLASVDPREYGRLRSRVSVAVRKVWRRLEQDFSSGRTKY